jgi:hypothetical protein
MWDCAVPQFAMRIEQEQFFSSPVLGIEVINQPDQCCFARVVRRVPPAR